MLTAKELLNKIKWDPRENPEEYSIEYYDRIKQELEKLNLKDINVEDNLLVFEDLTGEEINIPLHRIRIIRKNNEIVWQR